MAVRDMKKLAWDKAAFDFHSLGRRLLDEADAKQPRIITIGNHQIEVTRLSVEDRENIYVESFKQALTAQMAGENEKAITAYDVALTVKPDSADAHFNRGIALKDLGRIPEALACYDRAIAIDPDYAEAYYNRGKRPADDGACRGISVGLRTGRPFKTRLCRSPEQPGHRA